MGDIVRVACRIPNGVELNLTTEVEDGTGARQRYHKGEPVVLKGPHPKRHGIAPDSRNTGEIANEVDVAFWREWIMQNAEASLVKNGFIRELKD